MMSAHAPRMFEFFSEATEVFAELLDWAYAQRDSSRTLDQLERGLSSRGPELLRRVLQRLLEAKAERQPRSEGSGPGRARSHERLIESEFGEVYFRRLGEPAPDGSASLFALDAELNLPPERYSLTVREQVGRGLAQQPASGMLPDLKARGVHVPRRQAQQLAVAAARDVAAFYAQRPVAVNDTAAVETWLVGSHDSTGVLMRPEALRPSTRKKAVQPTALASKGDPMAPRPLRRHAHRMAAVGCLYDQDPVVRNADDIVVPLGRERPVDQEPLRLRPPRNKQVHASLTKNVRQSVGTLMAQMKRRDPDNQRPKVVLLDGEDKQLCAVKTEAKKLGLTVLIVLDLLHVLHYLWVAGRGLYPKTPSNAQLWVHRVLRLLLTEPPAVVLAFLRTELRVRAPSKTGRRKLRKCLRYLSNHADHIHYADYLARGLPIATGVIEGACRSLVKDRMAVTGARWGLEGAEAVLLLRAVLKNGDWDAYMAYHRQCEFSRNHGQRRAA